MILCVWVGGFACMCGYYRFVMACVWYVLNVEINRIEFNLGLYGFFLFCKWRSLMPNKHVVVILPGRGQYFTFPFLPTGGYRGIRTRTGGPV